MILAPSFFQNADADSYRLEHSPFFRNSRKDQIHEYYGSGVRRFIPCPSLLPGNLRWEQISSRKALTCRAEVFPKPSMVKLPVPPPNGNSVFLPYMLISFIEGE